MKNKKGQALVEFVIILPVIIYIIMGFIDMLLISNYKNKLESKIDNFIELYESNETSSVIDSYLNDDIDIHYKVDIQDKVVYYKLYNEYQFITPGLSSILGNPYEIKSERMMFNEA